MLTLRITTKTIILGSYEKTKVKRENLHEFS